MCIPCVVDKDNLGHQEKGNESTPKFAAVNASAQQFLVVWRTSRRFHGK